MKRFIPLLTALILVGGAIAASGQVREAKAAGPTVVATINGGGTALMQPGGFGTGQDKNVSSFGFHATLYADGTATGHVDCVDHHGDLYPGNIFGDVTLWSQDANGLNLYVIGTSVGPKGHPTPANFWVSIQTFGGAGVGHWTLGMAPGGPPPYPGMFCIELLLSGQIDARLN